MELDWLLRCLVAPCQQAPGSLDLTLPAHHVGARFAVQVFVVPSTPHHMCQHLHGPVWFAALSALYLAMIVEHVPFSMPGQPWHGVVYALHSCEMPCS